MINCYKYLGFEILITIKSSPLAVLIQVDPYNYGSIIKGQREQEVMIVAFCKDIKSEGKF